jgi:hypothetical protein
MKRRSATRLYAATVALLAIVFMLFPQIDLGIQRWFYRPGQGFVLDGVQPFAFIHDHLNWIAFAAVVLSVAVFVNNLRRDTDVMGLRWRGIIFVLVSLAVGPGLLANTVLKDNWGRARPSQIIEFGGTERFTPAPIVSNQCGCARRPPPPPLRPGSRSGSCGSARAGISRPTLSFPACSPASSCGCFMYSLSSPMGQDA